jgi:Fe2+ or Zn2+ uptake regulation protein
MENIFLPLQRRVILEGLEKDAGRTLSNHLLQRLLKAAGHNLSLGAVNEQINWLENRGLVSTSRLEENAFVVVKALRPGVEVAQGLLSVEGIEPPLGD